MADEYGIKFLEVFHAVPLPRLTAQQTSAKNSINVEEAFITLARDIKTRIIDKQPAMPVDNTLKLSPTTVEKRQKKCPCGGGQVCHYILLVKV